MLRDACLTCLDSPDASPERDAVKTIQLTVTFKDGKSETSDICKHKKKPSKDTDHREETSKKNEEDEGEDDGGENAKKKAQPVVFEVKELKDFPQASGFLDIQEIFVVTKNTDRETLVAQVRLTPHVVLKGGQGVIFHLPSLVFDCLRPPCF